MTAEEHRSKVSMHYANAATCLVTANHWWGRHLERMLCTPTAAELAVKYLDYAKSECWDAARHLRAARMIERDAAFRAEEASDPELRYIDDEDRERTWCACCGGLGYEERTCTRCGGSGEAP